jgi:hypothetical protein
LEQKLAAVMAPDTAMPILRKMKQVWWSGKLCLDRNVLLLGSVVEMRGLVSNCIPSHDLQFQKVPRDRKLSDYRHIANHGGTAARRTTLGSPFHHTLHEKTQISGAVHESLPSQVII